MQLNLVIVPLQLDMLVQQAAKYQIAPVERAGYMAAKILNELEVRLPPDLGGKLAITDDGAMDDEEEEL